MKQQLRRNHLPARLVPMVIAAMLAILGVARAPVSPAAAAVHNTPQRALIGRGPVLDDNQSDCVKRLTASFGNGGLGWNDSDAQAACTKLVADPPPKDPATYATLTSCFVNGIRNNLDEGPAAGRCRTKAQAGDASTTCDTYQPSPLRELSDARIDGSFCSAPRLGVGTDGGQYAVGDPITVCYTVPGPGFVTITDVQSTGSTVITSGNDDGRGDCLGGTISPPLGRECVSASFGGRTAQACFQVCNSLPCSGGTTTTTTQPAAEPYFVLMLDGYGSAVFVGRKSDVVAGTVLFCGPCTTVPKILGVLAGPFNTFDQAAADYCHHATNPHKNSPLGVNRIDAYGHKDLDADVQGLPSC
jgi:hypothetical protein